MEIRPLEDFPGYTISEHGHVYGPDGKERKQYMSGIPAYRYVNLPSKKSLKGWQIFRVHVLVGKTFIENPNGHTMLNHIDEDKMNCHHSNLEWCTRSHNVLHSMHSRKHPTHKPRIPADTKKAMVEEYRGLVRAGRRPSKRAIYQKYKVSAKTFDKALEVYY